MRNTWLLACVFIGGLVAGCHDASKDVEKLADRACACTDKACADKVVDDLLEFAKNNKNARGDQDKASKAGERLATCAIKAGADPSALIDKMKSLGD